MGPPAGLYFYQESVVFVCSYPAYSSWNCMVIKAFNELLCKPLEMGLKKMKDVFLWKPIWIFSKDILNKITLKKLLLN